MPSSDTYFKKGGVGNPRGRPKREICIPDILRKIGDEPSGIKDLNKLQAVMHKVYSQAVKGNSWAVQFIADRCEGKAVETVRTIAEEFRDNTNDPVEVPTDEGASDET